MYRLLPGLNQGSGQAYTVENGQLLEGTIIHGGAVVGLVGNGPDDQHRHLVQVGGLGDGCPFHLRAGAAKGGGKPLLLCLVADKLDRKSVV